MKIIDKILWVAVIGLIMISCGQQNMQTATNKKSSIRFATFNTAMFRNQEGGINGPVYLWHILPEELLKCPDTVRMEGIL